MLAIFFQANNKRELYELKLLKDVGIEELAN